MTVNFSSLPVLNNVCEWGAFYSTGSANPTDGVFFRLNALGEFRCVVNYNGTETQSGTLDFASLVGENTTKTFLIYVQSTSVYFWINNELVANIELPIAQGSTTFSQNLPISFRTFNSAATSIAQQLRVSSISVSISDQNTNKPWPHIMAGNGGHSSQGQTTMTMGSTALYTNNLAAGAGIALTNTTAAAGSGLGGQFSVQPTLAAGTDGILCSYQVPVATATALGKSLYITRITLNGAVTTALTGGPVLYAISLAYGHTNVSLATTESATAKAPRRMSIGFHSFPATATVGALGGQIDLVFETPIVVQPGEFIQIVLKNLGTVTSGGVITYLVSFGGYFE
jgi:hypothetical protein